MDSATMVDVVCIVYNHESYIRECLESLIGQKTTFAYRILVHDDASTDNSTTVIREYANKYPNLIVPVYQTENQYSKGIKISEILYPYIRSKYVAICEGDDYWTDSDKLQKQIDFLESHPDYVACVHNTIQLDCRTGKTRILYSEEYDKDLDLEDVVHFGGCAYHTSSLVRRKEYYLLPDEVSTKSFGDYTTAIYLALNGKIRYLKDVMSVYRMFSAGSFSSRLQKQSREKRASVSEEACLMLKNFDQYSDMKYHHLFQEAIEFHQVQELYILEKYKSIIADRNLRKNYMKNNSFLRICLLYYRALFHSAG